MLRKVLLLGAAAAVLASGAIVPTQADAQTVYCTNCSDRLTQLKQQADQALQLARQAEQLQTQLRSYEQQVRDGLSLPQHLFGDVARDIAAVNQVFQQAKGLAYTASNLDEIFAQRYGSFDSYKQAGVGAAQLQDKYRQWNAESSSTVLQTMRALGVQSQGMASEQDLLRQLQSQARSAQGHQQTLAVGNELAAENVAQMQRLRQLLMLQVQLQAQALQIEADREAVSAARNREFFGTTGTPPTYTGETY